VPAQAPLLRPLDDLFDAADLADFDPAALERCRWEGRLYALPRAVETRLLFYRSDLFDERREQQWFHEASGGRDLRVPRAWDELAAVAQYFTRAGKMYGFLFPGRGPGLVATFAEIMTTVGGTFFDPEGQPRFYSRAGEWTLTLLRDLYRRWEAVPPETPQCGYEDVSEAFRMGRCALACDFPATARLLCDPTFSAVAGWHSVALYPAGPQGHRAVWTGCSAFAIPAACERTEPAVAALRFLVSRESQLLEAKDGAIPTRLSALEAERDRLRPGTLGHLRFTLAEQTLRMARLTAPRLPQYREIEERLWPLLQQAVEGHMEPAEALQAALRAAEDALSA
ncbi:MAG TPA: extracellular solute-binding protein, partial [Armatimonadota bacterium]|nr:extracellular solute-binding protein [Armatimonadota bacterium]